MCSSDLLCSASVSLLCLCLSALPPSLCSASVSLLCLCLSALPLSLCSASVSSVSLSQMSQICLCLSASFNHVPTCNRRHIYHFLLFLSLSLSLSSLPARIFVPLSAGPSVHVLSVPLPTWPIPCWPVPPIRRTPDQGRVTSQARPCSVHVKARRPLRSIYPCLRIAKHVLHYERTCYMSFTTSARAFYCHIPCTCCPQVDTIA